MELKPIGIVRSPIREMIDENWGEVVAEIHVEPALADGLRGLEQFSHAIIVYHLHQAGFAVATDLQRHPRGRMDLPKVGIFAQRAKHRPNPIGLTAVPILSVKPPILCVKGLDAIDGTPVLDIKPYVPVFDRIENAVIADWLTEIMKGYF